MMMLRTKLQTRLLALLLMLSLLLTTVLFSSCQTVEPPEGEDTTDSETTEEQTTEEQTTEEQVVNIVGGKRPKIPNTATLDQNFADNKIVVGVQPYMIDYPYTKDDFAEVGCIRLELLMLGNEQNGNRSLHMRLTLDQSSKQHVLDMIKLLEKREDLYYAHPDMYASLD